MDPRHIPALESDTVLVGVVEPSDDATTEQYGLAKDNRAGASIYRVCRVVVGIRGVRSPDVIFILGRTLLPVQATRAERAVSL